MNTQNKLEVNLWKYSEYIYETSRNKNVNLHLLQFLPYFTSEYTRRCQYALTHVLVIWIRYMDRMCIWLTLWSNLCHE